MRAPEAKSGARISTLSTPQANATAFGASVGRAQQGFGAAVQQAGAIAAHEATEWEQRRVTRERIEVFNAASQQADSELQQKVFSLRGAQTDVLRAEDGTLALVPDIHKTAFETASKGRDPKVVEAAGLMWENSRQQRELRVGAHFQREQERAYLEATDHAHTQSIRFAAEGLAAGKPPEAEDFADAIAAASAYVNARGLRRTKGEVTREARAAVHAETISAMMAAGNFEQAGDYLKNITRKESPYRKDLSKKQIDLTRGSIESGAARFQKAAVREKQALDFNASVDALKAVSLGNLDLQAAEPILREAFGADGLKMIEQAEKRLDKMDGTHLKTVQNRAYWDFMKEVHAYKASGDKDGAKLRALMGKTFGFGELGDAARDELYLVASNTKMGGLQATEFRWLNEQVDGLIKQAVKRTPRKKRDESFKKITLDDEKTSEAALQLKSIVRNLAQQQDMTFVQAKQLLETHPVFAELRTTTDLQNFQDRLDAFDRSGTFGTPYQDAPWNKKNSSK